MMIEWFKKLRSATPPKYFLLFLIVGGLFFWFCTQQLIRHKGVPICGIWDVLQNKTIWFNQICQHNPILSNWILITSSFWIDFSAFFLFARSLFGSGTRPLIGVALFLSLRQLLQFSTALPIPAHMIWHEPYIPSLLVTYSVSNDLYFSSHTGMALLAANEAQRIGNKFFTFFTYFMLFYEMWTVITLQIHYTMDVYTALLTGFFVIWIANRIAPKIDEILCTLDSWIRK